MTDEHPSYQGDPVHERAEMLLDIGRPVEAIRAVERLLSQQPDRVDALVLLARANLAAGRNMAADRAARAALEIEPENVLARCLYAMTADALGRTDAIAHAEMAMATAPQLWLGHAVLGTVLAHAGRFEDAASAVGRAVALAPEEAGAHVMAGDVALAAGRLDAAERAYRTALGLAPDHAQARNNLGVVRMRRSGPATGLSDVAAAAALDPELPEARHTLAGYVRSMVARSGAVALGGVGLTVAGGFVAAALDGDPAAFRLLAGLLAVALFGWLASVALRTPDAVRSLVWSTIRTRRRYWSGPSSVAIVPVVLLAYAATGVGFLLLVLAVPVVGGALAVRVVDERLSADR